MNSSIKRIIPVEILFYVLILIISMLYMSIYSIIMEQDLIILHKSVEQQKNQRVLKIKYRILNQTHDNKLAKSLSPITKKLEEFNETTE